MFNIAFYIGINQELSLSMIVDIFGLIIIRKVNYIEHTDI